MDNLSLGCIDAKCRRTVCTVINVNNPRRALPAYFTGFHGFCRTCSGNTHTCLLSMPLYQGITSFLTFWKNHRIPTCWMPEAGRHTQAKGAMRVLLKYCDNFACTTTSLHCVLQTRSCLRFEQTCTLENSGDFTWFQLLRKRCKCWLNLYLFGLFSSAS